MTGNPKANGTERASAARTFALRAALSAAVIGLMLWIYDPREIFRKIEHLSIGFILFAWAFYAFCQLISAYRWKLLLSAKGVDLPIMRLFMFYMIGMFVNNFLPGGLGGDAVKAYSVYRSSGTVHVSVASVLVERFCGILALALLGGVACVIMLIQGEARSVALWMLVAMLGIAVAAAMVWSVRLASVLRKFLSVCAPRRIRDRAVQLMETVHSYRHDGWTLIWALLLSIGLQGMIAVYFGVVSQALDSPIPLIYFFLFLPLVTIATLAPISLGGLGVREVTMVYLFSSVGVSGADVLSVSLTAHVLNTALSLSGGLMLLAGKIPTLRLWKGSRSY